jgi:hypothetical protein
MNMYMLYNYGASKMSVMAIIARCVIIAMTV